LSFTTTAVSFITLGLGLLLCGWRFLSSASSQTKTNGPLTGVLIGSFLILFAIQNLMLGFGALFSSTCSNCAAQVLVLANTLLPIISVFGVYNIYYIFFP